MKTIKWDNKVEITLATGEKKLMESTAQAGEIAHVTMWLKNDNKYPFMITKMTHPDERIDIDIESAWINPDGKIKVRMEFRVPMKITPEDVIETADIEIKGFYRYTEAA